MLNPSVDDLYFYVFSQNAPVDKVLFLKSRATGRNLEVATLITSEGGYLRFWCLYGARNEMGMYGSICLAVSFIKCS